MVFRSLLLLIILVPGLLLPQEVSRVGVVRGRLQQLSKDSLSVQTNSGETIHCRLDQHTYLERDGQRVFVGVLKTEDPLEIIADRKVESGVCYARTIRIVAPGTRLINLRPYRSALEYLYPRGNMTFAGVVRRVNSRVLVLHTRDDAEKQVLLREDTRYLDSGLPADLSRLVINTRVFVRGGRNIENDLEAYQIIWGEIPGPKREY